MDKLKIYFCLFLLVLSFMYIYTKLDNYNLYKIFIEKDTTSMINSLDIVKFKDSNTLKKNIEVKLKNTNKKPIIYFYNSHQTEEYQTSYYGITPTVVTVADMLKDNLKEDNIFSLVEEKSIKKGLDKYNLDYAGCYEISLMYLKEKQRKYPSLNYYFDIHRDSVTGSLSRVKIKGKSYAKVMFLIGKNLSDYKKNEKNVKIMESYLNKKYPNLLRSTYYQPKYQYSQSYSENMFLVEVGGPDNTLEELYNTSLALSGAIEYYLEVKDEK